MSDFIIQIIINSARDYQTGSSLTLISHKNLQLMLSLLFQISAWWHQQFTKSQAFQLFCCSSSIFLGVPSGKQQHFHLCYKFPNIYSVKKATVFRHNKSVGIWKAELFLSVRRCLGSLPPIFPVLQQDTHHTAAWTVVSSQKQFFKWCRFSQLPLRPCHSVSERTRGLSLPPASVPSQGIWMSTQTPGALFVLLHSSESTTHFLLKFFEAFLSFSIFPSHTYTPHLSLCSIAEAGK